jgi:hypothetical protein
MNSKVGLGPNNLPTFLSCGLIAYRPAPTNLKAEAMMPDDFNSNMPEPPEELDEPDYDVELDWLSLLETYR